MNMENKYEPMNNKQTTYFYDNALFLHNCAFLRYIFAYTLLCNPQKPNTELAIKNMALSF